VTGKANRLLTSARLRRIERAIHDLTRWLTGVGVEPRSWRDPAVRAAAFPGARPMQSPGSCGASRPSSSDNRR
jgi:hypothetical protein